ncbi:hypothetical protein MUP65_00325 [Patescibacteria group bacterium]|nr:hypothetical protein [Patescibacteria group bacterium]
MKKNRLPLVFFKSSAKLWSLVALMNGVFLLIGLFWLQSPAQTSPSPVPSPSLDESFLEIELEEVAPYPQRIGSLGEPVLTASAAAVFDRDSRVFMWQKSPDSLRLTASTTKVMTALVAVDYFDLQDVIMVRTVSDEGQDMKLVDGELITVEALLYGLLVSSANDSAQILAQNYPGGEAGFVAAMNEKASQLGMTRSSFGNPSGLDGEGRGQAEVSYSTARELTWMANESLKNTFLAKVMATKQMVLQSPQGRYSHSLYNLNQLLWTTSGIIGVKTGWTEGAGECLISAVERDGRQLIVVVLGSQDRFGESKQLIDWALAD